MGFEVYEDDAAVNIDGESGNLIAWKTGQTKVPSLFLCAHMDTVVPGTGIEPVVEDGRVRSAGNTVLGGDDKAGIAAILEALEVLGESQQDHPPIELIFTACEEEGLLGSKYLDFEKIRSRYGYVLDADGQIGHIVTEGPAQNEFEIRIQGKAAHAGINPEEGINAIVCAARAIASLPVGRVDDETTCNIGTIHGGRARNIVAEECLVHGEVRSHSPAKLRQLTKEITDSFEQKVAAMGAKCDISVSALYKEIKLSHDDPVVKIAVEAARALDREPLLIRTGGGSDANIFNSKGIRCANLGIGMKRVHTADEYIEIADLTDSARYILKIIEQAGRQIL